MKHGWTKLLTALLCGCLLFGESLAVKSYAADHPSTENAPPQFVDVREDDWYYDSIKTVYQAGILSGDQTGHFYPGQLMTAQEGCAVLARLHQRHTGNFAPLNPAEGNGYQIYCIENKIMSQTEAEHDFNRENFVLFLSRIYDLSTLEQINAISYIPDYDTSTELGQSVLLLYQAGILSGTNAYGSFSLLSWLSRAQCAVMIARLLNPEKRVKILPGSEPLEMDLNFLTEKDVVDDFDGKFLYLHNQNSGKEPVYFVKDLYGRTIFTSENQIDRQQNGMFQIEHIDKNGKSYTSYYNTVGDRIFQSQKALQYTYSYGILAVQHDDGSIDIIDTSGNNVKPIPNMSAYRIAGEAFGHYIPVIPNENRNRDSSYWLDIRTGEVAEISYIIESSRTDKGHGYMVVSSFNKDANRYFYNVIDDSLELLLPNMMNDVTVLKNGLLWSEDDSAYYLGVPGEDIKTCFKSQHPSIAVIDYLTGRAFEKAANGTQRLINLWTGEIYSSFPSTGSYRAVGRKIIHPHLSAQGKDSTVFDLFDESGNMERENISQIWYGKTGEILCLAAGSYHYISA